jgi:hypothetical protein
MIAEPIAANLAFDVAQMLLLRLISFHVLIYASIVFMLGMLPESTPTYSALAVGDVFLFGPLSFGEKASS